MNWPIKANIAEYFGQSEPASPVVDRIVEFGRPMILVWKSALKQVFDCPVA